MMSRRGVACERCHRRRVRCDAWSSGLPCSACARSNHVGQCRLISSRRTRGADGKYTTPQDIAPNNASPAGNISKTPPDGLRLGPNTARSVTEPAMNSELARIYDRSSREPSPEQGSCEALQDSVSYRSPTQSRTHYVGESWYASYVLSHSASASGQTDHYRSIELRSSAPELPPSCEVEEQRDAQPDIPLPDHVERLVEAYFIKFHIFCPILDKRGFLESVRDGTVSPTLLLCVLFVASIHGETATLHCMGYHNRVDAVDDLFSKASAAFDTDQSTDRISLLLSAYLLHYWFGKPTTYRDALWWLGTAIRSAQCMGFHRKKRHGSATEKSWWRRIWWCLYVRDRQVSLSMGTPMTINDLDCDVETLAVGDFVDESLETARYVMLQVELNQIASFMFYRHCSPARLQLVQDNHASDESVLAIASNDILADLQDWLKKARSWELWKIDHQLSLILKVCHRYYTINLLQRLRGVSLTPAGNAQLSQTLLNSANDIARLIEDSLLHFTPGHFPMIFVSALLSAATVHVDESKHSQQSIGDLALRIRPYLVSLRQFERVYVMAGWVRSLFTNIMSRRHDNSPRTIMDAPARGHSSPLSTQQFSESVEYGTPPPGGGERRPVFPTFGEVSSTPSVVPPLSPSKSSLQPQDLGVMNLETGFSHLAADIQPLIDLGFFDADYLSTMELGMIYQE